jgi:hypothetical protein
VLYFNYELRNSQLNGEKEMNAAQQTYTTLLRGQTRQCWMAKIILDGNKIADRDFDAVEKTYLNKPGKAWKELEVEMQHGVIYESCEGKSRYFWLNGHFFGSLEQVLELEAQKPAIPTQSEISRNAWARAKELAGGSKGSKKYLSQAFKEVWDDIKAGTFKAI